MAHDNSVQLPTRASNSLRSKTIGRLSISSGKQPQTKTSPNPKSQTWHRKALDSPSASLKAVPRPNLTWEPGMFDVAYILRNLPLPRVVSCDHSLCDLGRGTMGFDCGQLLMLRTKNEMLRVQAGSLAVDVKDNKSLVETENRLVVPEDYKGWFAVLGTDMILKAIPHYRQVAQLAQSDCHTFLIGGTENVRAMKKIGETISESRHLCPGDLLKMGTLDETEKFLHCTDDNDRDVLIPVQARGTFYVMKNKTRPSKVPVLQIKDILQKYQFPCVVKLVYGREPTGEGVFTKLMVLEGVKQETSVLASTILKTKNTLHELSLDTPNKFRVAVQTKELVHNPGYISALNLCQDKGDLFVRSIKMFRHNPGRSPVEHRVSAMGISYASPKTSAKTDSPLNSKNLARSTSEPPPLPARAIAEAGLQHKVPTQLQNQKQVNNVLQAQPTTSAVQASHESTVSDVKETPAVSPLQEKTVNSEMSAPAFKSTSSVEPVEIRNGEENKPHKQTTRISVNGTTPAKPDVTNPDNQVNGVHIDSQLSSNQQRQRKAEEDFPPPPPMITEIVVKSEPIKQNNVTVVQGVREERPPVQVIHLSKPASSARPNAYEEVWTATSGKEDSANEELSSSSSSMSDFITTGMGGQVVTGGISEKQRSPSPLLPPQPPPPPPIPSTLSPVRPVIQAGSVQVTPLPKPISQAQSQQQSKQQAQSQQHSKPQAQSQQHSKPQAQSQQHSKPQVQSQQHSIPQAQSQQHSKPQAQSQQHSKPQAQSQQYSKPQAQSQQYSKTQPQTQPKPNAHSKTQRLQHIQEQLPHTQKPNPQTRPVQIPKTKPEQQTKPQSHPQAQIQVQPQVIPTKTAQTELSRQKSDRPPAKPHVQTINVMTSDAKKKQAKTLLEHYSTIDIVEEGPVIVTESTSRKKVQDSSYSTIDIVDDKPVIEDGSSSEADMDDPKTSRKKKVSFSDILDVQTFPEPHITSIEIHEEETERRDAGYRDTAPRSTISLEGWEIYTGRPSSSSEPAGYRLGEYNATPGVSGYTEDDSEYLMPVLDRKGRVKSGHRSHVEHSKFHGDLAKRLSLPNMRVTDTRELSRTTQRRDSENDILW